MCVCLNFTVDTNSPIILLTISPDLISKDLPSIKLKIFLVINFKNKYWVNRVRKNYIKFRKGKFTLSIPFDDWLNNTCSIWIMWTWVTFSSVTVLLIREQFDPSAADSDADAELSFAISSMNENNLNIIRQKITLKIEILEIKFSEQTC